MQVLALQLHLCPSAVPVVADKAGAGMKVSTDHGGGLWRSVEPTPWAVSSPTRLK